MKFTIDFMGLLNSQKLPVDQFAKRIEVARDRVRRIVITDPPNYPRELIGMMLDGLGVSPYPPLLLDPTEKGKRLSVDWQGLFEINELESPLPWLVKHTKLRHYVLYYMIFRDPTMYDRAALGATLNALGVKLYPPFFIESDEPRGPYEPATRYFRSRSPK